MYISMVFVRVLATELQRRGHDPVALLGEVGMSGHELVDATAVVMHRQWHALVQHSIRITGDEGLGLAVARRWSPAQLQLIGHVLISCATLRQALAAAARYRPLLGIGLEWRIEADETRLTFRSSGPSTNDAATRASYEALVGCVVRLMREYFETQPVGVGLRHDAPKHASNYAAVLGCDVAFRSLSCHVLLPPGALDRVRPFTSKVMHSQLACAADHLLSCHNRRSIASQVEAALAGSEFVPKHCEDVARALGLPARVLRRRLAREGVRLSDLLNAARLKRATHDLERGERPHKVIATDLGFSESSSFYRWFRASTGQTPSAFAAATRARRSSAISALAATSVGV